MCEINQLSELLDTYLAQNGLSFVSYTAKRLTGPGENYGSLMLAVDVKVKDASGQEKVLNMVAKKIPEIEFLREGFKVQQTFVKEMRFYDTIIPTLQQFQKDQGVEDVIDCFPKYFAGRINLASGSSTVDEDGVLLFENLKTRGYQNCDRMKGFDLDTARFILKDLAVFHAVPIAIKLKCPDVFEKKILPHIQFVKLFDGFEGDFRDIMLNQFKNVAKENKEIAHLSDRVIKTVKSCIDAVGTPYDGPFATITHNDFWVNNTMLKFNNNKPVSNKMVDFQVVDYSSLNKDVIFFLFSSVQMDILVEHYDEFIKLYFDKFIETLKQLKCDLEQFTFDAFKTELQECAREREFFHCLSMIRPILESPENAEKLKDFDSKNIKEVQMSEKQKEKYWFVVKEFEKHDWI